MHIHYVEDSKIDARALRHMLAGESDILLDVSETLDHVGAVKSALPIDVLLIDVVRPDSVSIETDVCSARRFTQAPILFVTGLDPSDVRKRALAAGADAVLRKGNLSGDLLRQFAENARVRASLHEDPNAFDEPEEPEIAFLPVLAIDGPLAFVEQGLMNLLQRTALPDWSAETDSLHQYLEILRHVRRLGARDLRQRSYCDASAIVQDLTARARAHAQRAGVHLSFGFEDNAWFAGLGHREDVVAGIEALVLGLILSCGRLDRLHIEVRKHGDTAIIEASCNRILLSGVDAFFGLLSAARSARLGSAHAYLQCAAALLTLRAEQVRMISGAGQMIEVSL